MIGVNIPVLIALPLYVLAFAAVAIAAHATLRAFVPYERVVEGHEVAGFIVAVVGVLYSVVLGFLVGAVWTSFVNAQQTTDTEAGYVADAFNFGSQTDPPQRQELQHLIAAYAIAVRDNELSFSQGASLRPGADVLIRRAIDTTVTMPPPKSTDPGKLLESNTIRSALIASLRNVGDARRLRHVQAQSRLPAGMREALLLGAAMVVAFAFFFGVKSFFKQMAMTGLLAGAIGLFFGLVIELSTPYYGAIHVSSDAWTYVIANNHLETFAK